MLKVDRRSEVGSRRSDGGLALAPTVKVEIRAEKIGLAIKLLRRKRIECSFENQFSLPCS